MNKAIWSHFMGSTMISHYNIIAMKLNCERDIVNVKRAGPVRGYVEGKGVAGPRPRAVRLVRHAAEGRASAAAPPRTIWDCLERLDVFMLMSASRKQIAGCSQGSARLHTAQNGGTYGLATGKYMPAGKTAPRGIACDVKRTLLGFLVLSRVVFGIPKSNYYAVLVFTLLHYYVFNSLLHTYQAKNVNVCIFDHFIQLSSPFYANDPVGDESVFLTLFYNFYFLFLYLLFCFLCFSVFVFK